HRIGWIEDIGDVVADCLSHGVACCYFIQAIVLYPPVQHFRCGVLQCVSQRTGFSNGEYLGFGHTTRPADPAVLEELYSERHFGCRLDSRSDDLAIALLGMDVTEEEQSTR